MFTEVAKGAFTPQGKRIGVRIIVQKKLARVSMDEAIFKKLGEPRFVKVLAGSGEHKGLFIVVPVKAKVENAYTVDRKHYFISVSANRLGVDLPEVKTTVIKWEIKDEGLIFDLRELMAKA